MIQTPSGERERDRDGEGKETKNTKKMGLEKKTGGKRKLARVNVSSIDEPGGSHYIRLALTAAVPAVPTVAA